MALSDIITDYILQLMEDTDGVARIKRSDLVDIFGCAPSQVNYVISTRFNPDMGYFVESRRGGGGYIKITRVTLDRENRIMHTVGAIYDSIDEQSARALIGNLLLNEVIDESQARIIISALSERALSFAPVNMRPFLRSDIFKTILTNLG